MTTFLGITLPSTCFKKGYIPVFHDQDVKVPDHCVREGFGGVKAYFRFLDGEDMEAITQNPERRPERVWPSCPKCNSHMRVLLQCFEPGRDDGRYTQIFVCSKGEKQVKVEYFFPKKDPLFYINGSEDGFVPYTILGWREIEEADTFDKIYEYIKSVPNYITTIMTSEHGKRISNELAQERKNKDIFRDIYNETFKPDTQNIKFLGAQKEYLQLVVAKENIEIHDIPENFGK